MGRLEELINAAEEAKAVAEDEARNDRGYFDQFGQDVDYIQGSGDRLVSHVAHEIAQPIKKGFDAADQLIREKVDEAIDKIEREVERAQERMVKGTRSAARKILASLF